MNTFDQMIERGHERVCYHQDPETGLRAIVAIHSTKLGNALGGTRRWHYATEADALYDVLRLSEGMTYKAAGADLPMGGGKSVILLPKPGHAPREAEARAMGRFVDTFNGTYVAAEDVGVDPEYVDWMALETKHVMGGLTVSTGGDPSPYTARGTVNAMKAALAHLGKPVDFDGLTVAIQGVGHVGHHLAGLLAKRGATVVVADIIQERVERAVDEFGVRIATPEEILTVECDILSPCALGGVIDANLARKLRCRIIAAAANNPLDDPNEDAVVLKNLGILYAPSFITNAGGLIRLASLYLGIPEKEIDRKIANIESTMAQVLLDAESMSSTFAAAIALASRRIAEGTIAPEEQVHAG
ncbi:MAG: Glu/Leu/Phe/Val family dehydrogenase [Planctomycetota bacterium]|jgi:leucine dehydrogenase